MFKKLISQDNNIKMDSFKLYSVPKFSQTDKALLKPENFNLNDLIEELESIDNDYYFRVHPNTQYTYFSDVDGLDTPIDDYIQKLINFMKKYYNVDLSKDDISYTNNKNKKGSYHIAIPKFNASTEKLKEIHTNLKNRNVYNL